MVQRVVYNSCFGGFGLMNEVVEWVREHRDRLEEDYSDKNVAELCSQTLPGETYPDGSGPKADHINQVNDFRLSRDNELLADIVAREVDYSGPVDGPHSSLRVAEVPDNLEWEIDEYDGHETVREKAQTFH